MHNLQYGIEYSPNGDEHNVIKLYCGNPLSAKNGMAPGQTVGFTYMFTWD